MMSFGLCQNIGNCCSFKIIDVIKSRVILPFFALAAACSQPPAGNFKPVPFVQDIISDTTSSGYSLVSSYDSKSASGPIVVIGAPEDVIMVTEDLLTCDYHNNVSGRPEGDGLPDFAGETVFMMLDMANSPYKPAVWQDGASRLREITARNFLSALDTVYYQSPYDTGQPLKKREAKLVVLASSLASVFGAKDIDTLCKSVRVNVPVFSRFQAGLNASANKGGASIVWASPEFLNNAGDMLSQTGASVERVFAPIDKGSVKVRLKDLLDKYASSGKNEKISSIILEDRKVASDSLINLVNSLKDTDDDEILALTGVLSSDFEFIIPDREVSEECYAYLRKINGFTHKIEYPGMEAFASTSAPDEFSYIYVELRDRYINDSLVNFMTGFAPKTFSLYVH